MEALEQQAFETLCKPPKKKDGQVFKRPAARAKAKAVPVSKAAAKAKAPGQKPCESLRNMRGTLETLGCPRCRGNWRGCTTCQNPLYGGIRTPGREQWKLYMERKQGRK